MVGGALTVSAPLNGITNILPPAASAVRGGAGAQPPIQLMNTAHLRIIRPWLLGITVITLFFPAAADLLAATMVTFSSPGTHPWTVPQGVTRITVDVRGAAGGDQDGLGGLGARVVTTLPVTPGQVLYVRVGGRGQNGSRLNSPPVPPGHSEGGFNGGANGGTGDESAAGGGGASDIRQLDADPGTRLVVAGGGGGAGTGGATPGGDGGDPQAYPGGSAGGGGGGTLAAGGSGGRDQTCCPTAGGSPGTFAFGGIGGSAPHSGGGGGGGYYGGGGGGAGLSGSDGGGGGGGSSFAVGTNTSFWRGFQAGDGLVNITLHPGPRLTVRCTQVEVCWTAEPGRAYQLQYRSSTTTNLWTDLALPVTASGPVHCVLDGVPLGEGQRIYRVQELP